MKQLQTAVAAAEAWTEQHSLIEQKLKETIQRRHDLVGIEGDVQIRLAESEAENALKPNPERRALARQALLDTRDEIEIAEAGVEGLRNRSIQHDEGCEAVHQELKRAGFEAFKEQRKGLNRKLREDVTALSKTVMQLQAIERAFGYDNVDLGRAKRALDYELRDLETGEAIASVSRNRDSFPWKSDPAAKKLFDTYGFTGDALRASNREKDAARERKHERAQAEHAKARQARMATAAR